MPTLNGQIVVNDGPGAVNGWLRIKSPYLINTHVRGVALHPALLSAIRSGTAKLRFGSLLGIDKTDPNKGYKLVAGTTAWATLNISGLGNATVIQANTVGGVFPCFQTSDSPDVGASGKTSIVDCPFIDVETDMIVGATAPAVGDGLRAQDEADDFGGSGNDARIYGYFGALVPVAYATLNAVTSAATARAQSVGMVTGIKLNVVNPNAAPGDATRNITVVTARIKGSAFGQF